MDSIIPGREFQNKNSQKQKNRNCFLPDKVQLLYWVLDSQFLGNVCNAVLSVPVGYFTRLPDQRCVVQLTTRNFLKEDTNLLYYKIDLFEDLMYLGMVSVPCISFPDIAGTSHGRIAAYRHGP